MSPLFSDFIRWYAVVQLLGLLTLPLTLRLMGRLHGRGYALSRILGLFLCGLILWLGTSYGILRNEPGGAWLATLLLAVLSLASGWKPFVSLLKHSVPAFAGGEPGSSASDQDSGPHRSGRRNRMPPAAHILIVELLFLVAFAAWTYVRARDPFINHTEQPMDLMFINGIMGSPTYPPRDPWLSGFAISYYYFGYWILSTVAHLGGYMPEVAYNVGQACWFGLLLSGGFEIGSSLFAAGDSERSPLAARLGGLLTSAAIGLSGNLHVLVEWLYAQGLPLAGLASWLGVPNFPESASVSRLWYIDAGWSWWWRASRVVQDTDLLGNHVEVIDEFPSFSYVLGDNHPHVLTMPFILLLMGLILTLFLRGRSRAESTENRVGPSRQRPPIGYLRDGARLLSDSMPAGAAGLSILLVLSSGLIFLNTWDFPPYFLLVLGVLFLEGMRRQGVGLGIGAAAAAAIAILGAGLLIYAPYFLTAQSQAGGILPNLFNPTRLPQFLLMFGHLLLAIGALVVIAWRERGPGRVSIVWFGSVTLLLPVVFLLLSLFLLPNLESGRQWLSSQPLPAESSVLTASLERWLSRPWTFLFSATLLALLLSLLWERGRPSGGKELNEGTDFALLLSVVGVAFILAPEVIYLRDFFGSRMNTVFKFYYQGWLLLAVAGTYAITTVVTQSVRSLRKRGAESTSPDDIGLALAGSAMLLILATLIFPVAAAYAKIEGFGSPSPTLDGIAYLSASERAAIEWIRNETPSDAIIAEASGLSYRADTARFSAATGRSALLGWDGHESQWRGPDYGEMAAGRGEALAALYQGLPDSDLYALLERWQIEYVILGPAERNRYGATPRIEEELARQLALVFESGDIRIYRAP